MKSDVSSSLQGSEWEYRAEIFSEADPRFEVNTKMNLLIIPRFFIKFCHGFFC